MSENFETMAAPNKSGVLAPLGALIGALLGAMVWAAVSALGYVTALVGVLIAWLAAKGYDMLGGKPGKVKVVTLIVCVIVAVAAGTVGGVVFELHNSYQEQSKAIIEEYQNDYGMSEEVARNFIYTESEFFEIIVPKILNGQSEDAQEVRGEVIKDFLMGLFFAALGSWSIIAASTKKASQAMKQNAAAADAPANASQPQNTEGQAAETGNDFRQS